MTKLLALIGVSLFAYFYINNALKEDTSDTNSRSLEPSKSY